MLKFAVFLLAAACSLMAEVSFVTSDADSRVRRVGSAGGVTPIITTSLDKPRGIVRSANGDLIVANYATGTGDGTIVRFPADGGSAETLASGLNGPTGLALGPDDFLYASVSGDNRVIKVTAPGEFATFATLANGANPQGLAFSPDGDLFVANKGTNTISKVSAAGAVSTFSDDVTSPTGVAFNSAGQIFAIHGGGSGAIVRFNPNGKSSNHVTGFSDPRALAIDRFDNFYVVNGGDSSLKLVSTAKEVSLIASGLSSPQAVAIAGPQVHVVAQKGDTLASEPVGAVITSLGSPAVAANGSVAFRAKLTAGIAGIASTNASGIWRDDASGNRALIARQSFIAEGTGGAVFAAFSDPVVNSAGRVAFRATLTPGIGGSTAGNAAGIWTDATGSLAMIARKGEQPPGVATSAKFANFTSIAINDAGDVVFQATITGTGITLANNTGLWVAPAGGAPALLIRTGDLLSLVGGPVKVTGFSALKTAALSTGHARTAAPDGGVTCLVKLADKTKAIVRFEGGTPTQIARTGETLSTTPEGTQFLSLYLPAGTDGGHVAYRALLRPGIGGASLADSQGIWRDTIGGTRELLARATFPATGTTGAVFASFGDPLVGSTGSVAFRGKLKSGVGDAVAGNLLGVWHGSPSPTLIARQGSLPPGLGRGTKFAAFISLCLPADAGPAFIATVAGTGITTANNQGIWALDADGALALIFRKGDKVGIGGNVKTITGFKFLDVLPYVAGAARSYAANGDLAILLKFSDLTHAVLTVRLP